MNMIYPLKFQPVCKDKVWGGHKLKQKYNKPVGDLPNCGESWEISGIEGSMSVVANGALEENDLGDLIEILMGELLGDKVFEKYGYQFPMLVKMIDTLDVLSVQVHPNDEMALKAHNCPGKEEMWYILDAGPEAEMFIGFNQNLTKELFLRHLNGGTLKTVLNVIKPQKGDVYHIKPGCIHAIGKDVTLIEIQQSSDITYRLYDWDRPGADGRPRELHLEKGLEALDYKELKEIKVPYQIKPGLRVPIVEAGAFSVNLLELDTQSEFDYNHLDSFVILSLAEGSIQIEYSGNKLNVDKGESVLIPSECGAFIVMPQKGTRILESYCK
ncbi:MAG: mannose-6-phosphate isomerase [Bacteroidales bacterium]|nr:mannose-6-phosphate isomerase [Bacteroidales bacterium]